MRNNVKFSLLCKLIFVQQITDGADVGAEENEGKKKNDVDMTQG